MAEESAASPTAVAAAPSPGGSLNGIMASSENYEELDLIGTGAYGTVYKARDRQNPNNFVALKKVRIPLTEDGIPLSTIREVSTLKRLGDFQNPNVVRLLDVCHGPSDQGKHLILYLVFEHCEQDLASYIENARPHGIPRDVIWSMSKEIISGIDFLHSHRIIHRDLKPQNLLVTSSGNIKLADFGLAKTYDSEMKLTTVVVTLWYRPPEVLLGQAYHSAVDIWSAGVVLFELHSLKPLFPGRSEVGQLDEIFRVIGLPEENLWPDNSLAHDSFPRYEPKDLSELCPTIDPKAKDLIMRMLSFNIHQRPTAMECLADTYFKPRKVK